MAFLRVLRPIPARPLPSGVAHRRIQNRGFGADEAAQIRPAQPAQKMRANQIEHLLVLGRGPATGR